MAERLTGVRLPAGFLTLDMPGVIIEEIPEDLVPEGAGGRAALQDEFIQRVIAEPTLDKLPAIADFLVRILAEDSGIIDEPAVRELLEAVTAGRPPGAELHGRLVETAERYFQQSRTRSDASGMELFQQGHAVRDLIAAAFPGRSPLSRVTSGGYIFRDADRHLQAHVLRQCAYRAARDVRKASTHHDPPA